MRQNFSMWHMKPVHSPCGGDGVGAFYVIDQIFGKFFC